MSETKVTKRDRYLQVIDVLNDHEDTEDLIEFCEHEIAALDVKAEKARERAEKKRAEGDDYKAMVAGALTDELQTRVQIFEAVGDEEFTLGKVQARLTALIKDGIAVKEAVKEDKRTVMAYRLA